MGYYSDVAVVMRRKQYTELLKSIHAIADKIFKHDVMHLLKAGIVKKSPCKEWVVITWTNRKWYEDKYSDVAFFQDFFDKLMQTYPASNYRIIRIGADYDDIEIYGECNEGIYLNRSIKIEFE